MEEAAAVTSTARLSSTRICDFFFLSVYLGKATAATGVALPRSAGVCDFDVFTVCAAIRIVLTLLPRQPVIPFPTLLLLPTADGSFFPCTAGCTWV